MEKMSKIKVLFMVGAFLLGTLFLANTPDEVPTGTSSVEDQLLEKNNTAFVEEMKAKEERLRNNVSNVMAEHDALKKQFAEKRASIDARSEANRASIEAHRSQQSQAEAEMDAIWGKEKPHEYK